MRKIFFISLFLINCKTKSDMLETVNIPANCLVMYEFISLDNIHSEESYRYYIDNNGIFYHSNNMLLKQSQEKSIWNSEFQSKRKIHVLKMDALKHSITLLSNEKLLPLYKLSSDQTISHSSIERWSFYNIETNEYNIVIIEDRANPEKIKNFTNYLDNIIQNAEKITK